MSNVTVTASDETGLVVDVVLGANVRKSHEIAGGDSKELTVGGGQVLTVRAASNVAPTAEAVSEGVDVDENDVVAGGDDDAGDGTGRTVNEVVADEEAAASRPDPAADAVALGADLFADES